MRAPMAAALLFIAANAAGAECRDEVLAILEAQEKAGPFRVEMRGESDGQQVVSSGEIQLPDRFHMTMPEGEMIMVPEGIWMKQGGAWMQLPETMVSMMQGMISRAAQAPREQLDGVECLGEETVEGTAYKAYSYNSEDEFEGIRAKARVKLYADPATGLPARLEIDGESMGVSSRVIQTITFDHSISIEPPQ